MLILRSLIDYKHILIGALIFVIVNVLTVASVIALKIVDKLIGGVLKSL
jgi:hypothetical protein